MISISDALSPKTRFSLVLENTSSRTLRLYGGLNTDQKTDIPPQATISDLPSKIRTRIRKLLKWEAAEIEISSGKGSISPASFLGDTLLIDIVLTLLEISTLQHGRISGHSM